MMRAWAEFKEGSDGLPYSVRYLATEQEIDGWQAAGIVGEVSEIVGMQHVAEQAVALIERDLVLACGGVVQ